MITARERRVLGRSDLAESVSLIGLPRQYLGGQTLSGTTPQWTGTRPLWERRYALLLPLIDSLLLVGALLLAFLVAPGVPASGAAPGWMLVLGLVGSWVLFLAVNGAYESRLLGQGPEEYKRVLTSSWHFAAVLAIAAYAIEIPVPRGIVVTAIPLGLITVLGGRHGMRAAIRRLRAKGRALHRVFVVGPAYAAADAIRQLNAEATGFKVVGISTSGLIADGGLDDVSVSDGFGDVLEAVARCGADTVAVVGTADMPTGFLRDLVWKLEGTGVDLMLSPALTNVAGPRIHIRPIARLAMLYVEEPQFHGATRWAKEVFDRTLAVLMLLVLLPLLLVIMVLIRLDSPGCVFFRQLRAGLHGEYFGIWKFRTMHVDAEQFSSADDLSLELSALGSKTCDDPRVTKLGRLLRATSLDELPQLVNVVLGQMSLVGPRPLRQHEVESFADHELRRHLVKPGMTGLWQVSGRSTTNWEERVRLDLHYVENWSPWLDLVILLRTVGVVLRRSGAY